MIVEAIQITAMDLIAGLGFALVVGTLALLASDIRKRPQQAKPEPEPEAEVIEAFSEFPDHREWRRATHNRCDRRAA